MSKIEELAERVERLLLRHEEIKRTNALLEQQLAAVTQERDSLRSSACPPTTPSPPPPTAPARDEADRSDDHGAELHPRLPRRR
jgi:hypothetical protein